MKSIQSKKIYITCLIVDSSKRIKKLYQFIKNIIMKEGTLYKIEIKKDKKRLNNKMK